MSFLPNYPFTKVNVELFHKAINFPNIFSFSLSPLVILLLSALVILVHVVKVNVSAVVLKTVYLIKVFQDGELVHYVDGGNDITNWMKFINCARHEGEQNLVLIQEGQEIFYETNKDIYEGTELLIWYGDNYLKYMGIPITMKTKIVPLENNIEGMGKCSRNRYYLLLYRNAVQCKIKYGFFS